MTSGSVTQTLKEMVSQIEGVLGEWSSVDTVVFVWAETMTNKL